MRLGIPAFALANFVYRVRLDLSSLHLGIKPMTFIR
jgi:hypothetical protein